MLTAESALNGGVKHVFSPTGYVFANSEQIPTDCVLEASLQSLRRAGQLTQP